MSNLRWVKWKNYQGVKYLGENRYNPPQPWGPWSRILGVVARCEGNHDTVVSYDNTGLTFGFQQWAFTSGRLQKLLQSFKAVSVMDFTKGTVLDDNLFNYLKCSPKFKAHGFDIQNGMFIDAFTGRPLDPRNGAQKKRMIDLCMGRAQHKTFADQKAHAKNLAQVFVDMGKDPFVADAQIAFAKQEYKLGLKVRRKPLKDVQTIENLLDGTWNTPAPALFYNLAINNPQAAYRLFLSVHDVPESERFAAAWEKVNRSKFGNWGWGKPENKSPRVVRIKKAIKEFYGIDLRYFK